MWRASVILILLAHAATAAATPSPENLARHGVDVVGTQWDAADLDSLLSGAQAVPEALRADVGAVRFVRGHRRCPFAMGAYNRTCPTHATEEDAFVIYDGAIVAGQGPVTRLAGLTDVERRDVLVRRAVVHAFVAAFDRRHRWSDDPIWRRLDYWREGSEHPFNQDPWGFSRYLGMRSAHLDFVTFAEEFFVRPQRVDPDLAVQCQQFSKSRFIARRLREIAPQWEPPRAVCPAFDAWSSLETLEGIDVLFAAATADRPQSLWGHLLVHLRHRDRADGFEPVYQFGAVIAANINPLEYLGRGLMGGFHTVLDPYTYREIDREILRTEQRSLKRYRLELSPSQTMWVLQRIWEMERRVRLPYWFFDENCAAFLADLLQSALFDLEIPDRSEFIVAPTDVLDLLADVDNPPRGPLLRKLPEESLSNQEQARWARARRKEALGALRRHFDGEARARFDAAADGLEARSAARRAEAYGELGQLFASLAAPEARQVAARVLHYDVVVERYYLETRITEANEVWARTRIGHRELSADERLARRRALYEHEDAARRAAQRLAWDEDALAAFQSAERRPLRAAETRAIAEQDAARRAFAVAVAAQREYLAHAEGTVEAEALRRREAAVLRDAHASRDERSIGRSGKERFGLGLAGALEADVPRFAIAADFAFLDERLGSQRSRGFRPDIETRVFALRLRVPWSESAPVEFDLDLLRYLTVERLLVPARRSLWGALGYGFDIAARRSPTLGIEWALKGSGGLILPVWSSASMTSFLVLGGFPMVEWLAGGAADGAVGGVWFFARAQAHLFGNYANVVRLEASATPLLNLRTLSPGAVLAADLGVELYLGTVAKRPLLVVARGGAERTDARLVGDPDELNWTSALTLETAL